MEAITIRSRLRTLPPTRTIVFRGPFVFTKSIVRPFADGTGNCTGKAILSLPLYTSASISIPIFLSLTCLDLSFKVCKGRFSPVVFTTGLEHPAFVASLTLCFGACSSHAQECYAQRADPVPFEYLFGRQLLSFLYHGRSCQRRDRASLYCRPVGHVETPSSFSQS